jgi:hypothetical protein
MQNYLVLCQIYHVRESSLTLNLLTTAIVALPSNASKWQMGFNSAFEGLMVVSSHLRIQSVSDTQDES